MTHHTNRSIEQMFRDLYHKEPTGLELLQFKPFAKYKKRESKLWGAVKEKHDAKEVRELEV